LAQGAQRRCDLKVLLLAAVPPERSDSHTLEWLVQKDST